MFVVTNVRDAVMEYLFEHGTGASIHSDVINDVLVDNFRFEYEEGLAILKELVNQGYIVKHSANGRVWIAGHPSYYEQYKRS